MTDKMAAKIEMKTTSLRAELGDVRAEMVRALEELAARATRQAEALRAEPEMNPSSHVGMTDELRALYARHESVRETYRLMIFLGKE